MRLEELLNQYSDRLSENDLYIWDYVEKHKKQCENMTIEELARKCNVSRTTVLRFTKKLSLKGFGEFKVHLKMENDDKKQDTSKADLSGKTNFCIWNRYGTKDRCKGI